MVTRRGFTLIEVVVALVILMAVMVQFVVMTGQTTNTAATSERQEAAIELALDRISQIRSDPNYQHIDSAYVWTENSFPGLPGVKRTTTAVHDSTATTNYKIFTVKITGPGLATPVSRTTIVAAP
jgi:prepilin-type N-terminal cleavage/methylation domain-containing protein